MAWKVMEKAEAPEPSGTRRSWVYIAIIIAVAIITGVGIWLAAGFTINQNVKITEASPPVVPTKSTATPQLTTEDVVSGYGNLWDMAFLPTKDMLFTERKGMIHIYKDGKVSQMVRIDDVYARGEGGLMGMAVDPKFTANRFIYTCFNSTKGGPDVRVARWRVHDNGTGLDARTDIITGIPSNSTGRHSGCRIAFGPDGYLWVGTGDAAQGDTGMQPRNLGGKVLRVDRDGNAAPGNIGGQFDPRIFSYGHRNIQGIAFFPSPQQGALGVSVEHGSSEDDEVNILRPGNFGWAPPPQGYEETGVPMTDKKRFPDAIEAIWRSGTPTQAPSGAVFLHGPQWKAWDGALAVAILKDTYIKVLHIDTQGSTTGESNVLKDTFGRLRAAVQGPDGLLYISTDNPAGNRIIRVTPH